jgi:dGTPase
VLPLTEKDLKDVDWVWDMMCRARAELGADAPDKFVRYRAIGELIDQHVTDVLTHTDATIRRLGVKSVDDVRALRGTRIIAYSPEMHARLRVLKDFLMRRVYRHPVVVRMSTKAERFVERMFNLYVEIPEQLPLKYQSRIERDGLKRVVTDYISGMTDRYLQDEYVRAFEPTRAGI